MSHLEEDQPGSTEVLSDSVEMSNLHGIETDVIEPTAPLIERDITDTQSGVKHTGKYDRLFVWFLTVSAGISGLLFGYDTGVISSMLVSIGSDLSHRELTTLDKSLITSCTSLFALLASPLAGILADRIGRKGVIYLAGFLFIVGALWQAVTHEVVGMIAGRSIVGLGIGAASLVVPLYISELAPSEVRGTLVTVNCLFVTGGQVVAYVVGWAFSGVPEGWKWMVGLGALPAVIQVNLLLFMAESPRWLVKVNRVAEAKAVLSKIYKSSAHSMNTRVVDEILQAIEEENLAEDAAVSNKGVWASIFGGSGDKLESLFYVGAHRRALGIACLLQGLQQLCGFNSLMYFSATIFKQVGYTSPTLTSLSVAMTNFVLTLAAFYLIDRIGRRRILLYSVPFMVISLFLCAAGFKSLDDSATVSAQTSAYVILASIVVYVAAYALGLGNVPWQQSELFPLSVRSTGSAIATSVNWSSNTIVGLTFLPMMTLLSPGWTFVSYGIVCAIGWVCIWLIYPETMGLGLEEVSALLQDGWGVQESLERRDRQVI